MSTTQELKINPCSKCGCSDEVIGIADAPPIPIRDFDYSFHCRNCEDVDCQTSVYGKTREEALEAWNDRNDPSSPPCHCAYDEEGLIGRQCRSCEDYYEGVA